MPSPFRYFYKESLLTIYTERQKNLPFCCANRTPQSGNFPLCGCVHIVILRNCSEITHDNYLSKCPSASSENLDIARYACDFLLCSWTFIRRTCHK